MGALISSQMDGVMKRNIENMAEMQRVMLERNIEMQNYMRERQMAMQRARQRELFDNWLVPFYALCVAGGTLGAVKGKLAALAPLVPLTFLIGYQYDLAYGSKLARIRASAGRILDEEADSLSLPSPGLPTVDELDSRRLARK